MSLAGIRVLLVEDEAIIAMTAEDMLEELGCATAAVASSLPDAMAAAARRDFDIALLDINLNGVESLPVAAMLKAAGLPFVFTTGYGATGRDAEYDDVPLVTKPYQMGDLAKAIVAALHG
jgi:CheY-like chemotaxis protein